MNQKTPIDGVSKVRPTIRTMEGYTPGEQPRDRNIIKLNTNENPYPPSPAVYAAWRNVESEILRRYPDPVSTELREAAANQFGFDPEQIIAGNGSDDLLTVGVRTFVDAGQNLGCPEPSYSLYPVLAKIQGAKAVFLPLDENFQLPEEIPEEIKNCPLFFVVRPNAPSSNSFPRKRMEQLCREINGIIWIDEAYADFGDDDCLDFVNRFPNVIVSRTLSKSYSLAGLRVGLAFGEKRMIEEMLKVKDSYNISLPAQIMGTAALNDTKYMKENTDKIRNTRDKTKNILEELGFQMPSPQANFIFAKPPISAENYVVALRKKNILIRYFPAPRTANFVRITIGTEEEMECFLDATAEIIKNNSTD